MRLLIIVPDADGNIRQAEVHDVQNEATRLVDGGLLLEDGRLHVYPATTLLFDVASSVCQDVLAWGRDGKYLIVDGALHEIDDWQLVIPEPGPPPEVE